MASFDEILARLGSFVLQSEQGEGEIYLRISVSDWSEVGQICRQELGLDYFGFLSALDWMINKELDGEKVFASDAARPSNAEVEIITDETVRRAGGTSRFQVFARVGDVATGVAVMLFADLGDDLNVASWVQIYKGADWHERETWEMFGINFLQRGGLRHIYLPEGFEGYPLRKDFALLARQVRPWPGLVDLEEMPPAEEVKSDD